MSSECWNHPWCRRLFSNGFWFHFPPAPQTADGETQKSFSMKILLLQMEKVDTKNIKEKN
jgi:hypothetical protein